MAERRIMKTLFDDTNEFLAVGESMYHLINVDSQTFTLTNTNQSNIPFVVIVKITTAFGNTKRIVFESYKPLSHFEKAEDRAAIKLAINFLEEKYQS